MAGTVNLADTDSGYLCRAIGQEQVICQGAFTLGSSGAIASSAVDDSAMTLANDSGTGVHALTYPACPEARISVRLVSASLTVTESIITAKAPTSGTATIKLAKAGTLAQAASGNIIHVTVIGKVTS